MVNRQGSQPFSSSMGLSCMIALCGSRCRLTAERVRPEFPAPVSWKLRLGGAHKMCGNFVKNGNSLNFAKFRQTFGPLKGSSGFSSCILALGRSRVIVHSNAFNQSEISARSCVTCTAGHEKCRYTVKSYNLLTSFLRPNIFIVRCILFSDSLPQSLFLVFSSASPHFHFAPIFVLRASPRGE